MRSNKEHHFLIGLIFVCAALFAGGCGPMNSTKLADSLDASFKRGGISTTTLSSVNKIFLVYSIFADAEHKPISPVLGDNPLFVRTIYAADLRALSDSSKLTIKYFMPEMPDMGTTTDQGVRQPDGTFTASLFLSMAGRWSISLTIEDSGVSDTTTYETKI